MLRKSMLIVAMMVCGLATRADAERKVHWLRRDNSRMISVNITGTNSTECYWTLTGPSPVYAPHIDWFYDPGKLFIGWAGGRIDWYKCDGSRDFLKGPGSGIDALVLRPGTSVFYSTYDGEIRKIDLDGTDDVHVYWPAGRVTDMAFASNKLWWGDTLGIHSVTPAGTSATTIVAGGFTNCGLDVDTAVSNKIFWVCPFSSDGGLWSANLDGSDRRQLRSGTFGQTSYPRADGNGYVYWADALSNKSYRIYHDGTGFEEVAWLGSGPANPNQLTLEYGLTHCSSSDPFGDIIEPHPAIDFKDITQTVQCFLANVWGAAWDKCDLYPCGSIFGSTQCIGDGRVDFKDIAMGVSCFVNSPNPPSCD